MKKFSLNKLIQKDIKIVEKRKWFFIASGAIIVLAMILMSIYWAVLGSPLNLGMDFTGGYAIQIDAGTKINEDNYGEYIEEVTALMNDYVYESESGDEYQIRLNKVVRIGESDQTGLRIEFRAPINVDKNGLDTFMEDELIPDLVDKLNEVVAYIVPKVTLSGSTATIAYNQSVLSFFDYRLGENLKNAGITLSSAATISTDYKTITLNLSGNYTQTQIEEALMIKDIFGAQAKYTDMVGGTVRSDLIVGAITAVIVALILMLIYIIVRFEFVSGLSTIVALAHDIIMVFMLMIAFRVEFNSTFIAALITIIGYSINNTIIIFDRLRENLSVMFSKGGKELTSNSVANRSVLDSLSRTITTTATTLIMIGIIAIVCAFGGITDMVMFALPIIFGILSGFYSSNFIAPSVWSLIKQNNLSPSVSKFAFLKSTKNTVETPKIAE